jgi:hypothetical protein
MGGSGMSRGNPGCAVYTAFPNIVFCLFNQQFGVADRVTELYPHNACGKLTQIKDQKPPATEYWRRCVVLRPVML